MSQGTSTLTKEKLMEEIRFSKKEGKCRKASCLSKKDEKHVSLYRKGFKSSLFLKSRVNFFLTARWHLCTAFEIDSSKNRVPVVESEQNLRFCSHAVGFLPHSVSRGV